MKQWILWMSLFLATALSAQQHSFFFENIGVREGLSYPGVNCIFRDSRGFLWICTAGGGLNRYDGHEMKVFFHNNEDSLTICGNNVNNIVEAPDGMLWIGSTAGVSRLNPASGLCENYTQANGRLTQAWICTVFLDNQGQVWTINHGGIERYDPVQNRFVQQPVSQYLKSLGSVVVDRNGTFWMGSIGDGVKRYDPSTGRCYTYLIYPKNEPSYEERTHSSEKNTATVYMDDCGDLWVTGGGNRERLYRFYPNSGKFDLIEDKRDGHMGVAQNKDRLGNRIFWLMNSNGLNRMALPCGQLPDWKGTVDCMSPQNSNLANTQFSCLYADGEGNIWVGTRLDGVYRFSSRQDNMRNFRKVKTGSISNIRFTPAGDGLICGAGNPLTIVDNNMQVKKEFRDMPPHLHNRHSGMAWDAVYFPADEKIYITSFNGHTVYDPRHDSYTFHSYDKYKQSPNDPTNFTYTMPLPNNRLIQAVWFGYTFVIDNNNHTLIKALTKGALIVRSLFQERRGTILACMEGALLRYDPLTYAADTIFTGNTHFFAAVEDRQGQTWLATNFGLWMLDETGKKLKSRYGINEGLPAEEIYRMTIDSLDRLWIVTDFGTGYYEPEKHHFYKLSKRDGYDFRFESSELAKDPAGRIWLTNGTDISIFKPEDYTDNNLSHLYITGLKVNGKDTLVSKTFEQLTEIRLKPGENVLTFDFTATDLEEFGRTHFEYQLEGYADQWVFAGKNRSVTFANVPAGAYTFRVHAVEAAGDHSRDAMLKIVVTNYFWQRTWFRSGLLGLILLAGIALFIRWNSQRLRRRVVELEKEQLLADSKRKTVESEMKALRAQMNPHFVFNSLNSINAYILRNLPEQASAYLARFGSLMRRILDHSAQDAISLEAELEFVRDYLQAEGMRLENKLQFDIAVDESVDPSAVEIPSMVLQPFLENAVWHGIAPRSGGHIMLQVCRKDNDLLISVQDDGVGRTEAQAKRRTHAQTHESRGLKITLERLALYDRKYNTQSTVETTDLTDAEGRPTGTRIEIAIRKPK